MTHTIVYLHGFKSSPQSIKAQLLAQAIAQREGFELVCPQLVMSPAESMAIIASQMKDVDVKHLSVMGSSLGGYYATWLAEKYGCTAVLLNPVVDPWRIKILEDEPDRDDLEVREWLQFRENYQQELNALRVENITDTARYLLLSATGDELLDWQLMCSHYQGAHQIVVEGDNHGLSCFPTYLETVLTFCRTGRVVMTMK